MIAREAVYNAYRHGRATEVTIDAQADERALRLCIRDNGCGFDTSHLSTKAHGMSSIQRRAERHNGDFAVQSSSEPGASGTTLQVVFHLAGSESDAEAGAEVRAEARVGERLPVLHAAD